MTIAEIIGRRESDLLPLLSVLGLRELTIDEREALREGIADEFTENGLDENDEPNEYGLMLERLIDLLGHF